MCHSVLMIMFSNLLNKLKKMKSPTMKVQKKIKVQKRVKARVNYWIN